MSIEPLRPQPPGRSAPKSVQKAVARLRRTWAPVDRFVQRHNALVAVAPVAAIVHAAQAIAWPLDDSERRDSADYFLTYLELGEGDPLFPEQALARPPVAPLVLGGSMDIGGPTLLEAMMCVAFVTTITAYFAAARHFGSLLAVAVADVAPAVVRRRVFTTKSRATRCSRQAWPCSL